VGINRADIKKMKELYESRYQQHGYDPKTLGWFKGKQKMRFSILTSQVDLEGMSILDVGCGFGDLNFHLKSVLKEYQYYGIDCVDSLIDEAVKRHPEDFINFNIGDFLDESPRQYDYIVASGIFNYNLDNEDNYSYISKVMKKSFDECTIGVAFDFLSDKVDYKKYDVTFHSNPSNILDMAYGLTRNIVLRNDYAPFEFSIFLFKNDSFNAEDTVFQSFKEKNPELISIDPDLNF
jgi:SAM-dependent methyltransferase